MSTKWAMWRITKANTPPSSSVDVHALYDQFNAYRADIIDGATYVENILDAVLCDALVGKNEAQRERIQTAVLSARFDFLQKWKALRGLLKEKPNWLNEELPKSSELIKDLHAAIRDRNKFAHGTVSVDSENMHALLRYIEDGEQTLRLSEEHIESIMTRMKSVYFWLEALHLRFHG